ncbi:retrovirus-related pol polyprotein from transposon TNT 1-94, partial [Tanacetum coccineum]
VSKQKEDKYLDEVIDLQKKNKALDNVVYKMGQSTQTMHMLTKPQAFYDESHKTALGYQNTFYLSQARRKVPALYDGHTIFKQHDALFIPDTEETLDLAEEKQAFWLPISQPVSEKPPVSSVPVLKKKIPRELPTIRLVKDSFHKIKEHINKFDETITFHTKITGNRIGSWGVEHIKGAFEKDVKHFAQILKEYFHMFENGLYKELKDMKAVFNQIETEVSKCSVDRKYFEIKKKELSIDNDRLLEHIISQDAMDVVMHADVHNVLSANNNCLDNDNLALELLKMENELAINDYKSMEQSFLDEYEENLKLQTELDKKNDTIEKVVYNELSKRCSRLKNLCISLEIKLQQSKESFQTNRPSHNQDAPEFKEFFIINDLQARLKAKNISIEKLKEHIANIKEKNVVERVSSSTEASGSKPRSNTKKDRIMKTSSSNKKKNKVEYQPRIAKSGLNNVNCVSKTVSPISSPVNLPDNIEQIILWYLDSGCSKHMTGQRSQLINFVSKFLGTARFGNDQIAKIMGYGDYQLGTITISRVYYVEGLGHNLFSVGQFCDLDLEVAFQKHTCYVRNLDGADLIFGSRDTNLYTISLDDMLKSSPIYLLSKSSKTKSWLWHRRLSHINFDTLNQLAKQRLVRGLPKLKFEKDHLCSACSLGKSKKYSHKPKADDTNQEKLNLLHMDLCGPMRVESINRKKYILVVVDDYSRFMWVKFLRSKDKTPKVIIKCLKQI